MARGRVEQMKEAEGGGGDGEGKEGRKKLLMREGN